MKIFTLLNIFVYDIIIYGLIQKIILYFVNKRCCTLLYDNSIKWCSKKYRINMKQINKIMYIIVYIFVSNFQKIDKINYL